MACHITNKWWFYYSLFTRWMQCSGYVYQRICLLYALRSCCCFHPEYGTMIQFGSPTQDYLVVIAFCEKQLPYISFGCTRAFKLVYQQGLIAEITWHHGPGQGLHAQCWTAVGWGQPCSSALRCRCSAGCCVRSRLGNVWSSHLRRCNDVLWCYDVTCSEMMLHVWHDMTWKAHAPRLAPRQLARGNPRGRWKPWRPHSCCGALQEWP